MFYTKILLVMKNLFLLGRFGCILLVPPIPHFEKLK